MKNILLLTIFFMAVKPFWPIAEYVVRYDFIVSTLCENRETPEMECNGKCYLSKQLAKQMGEQDEQSGTKPFQLEISQNIISENLPVYTFENFIIIDNAPDLVFKPELYTYLFTSDLLKPPLAIS